MIQRTRPFVKVERVRGIEPPYLAWEANVLPLNYTRRSFDLRIIPERKLFSTTALLVQHDIEEQVIHPGHALL